MLLCGQDDHTTFHHNMSESHGPYQSLYISTGYNKQAILFTAEENLV